MIDISETLINRIIAHAAAAYPSEACGLLIGRPQGRTASQYRRCDNIYDAMHAKDPEAYPRTSRTAYMIDPKQQERFFEEVRHEGLEVLAICHSHADHDAYFSAEDRTIAGPWGEPLHAGVDYIVTSIVDGTFGQMNLFSWDEKSKDWKECKLK